eukprot:gene9455-biopygen4603
MRLLHSQNDEQCVPQLTRAMVKRKPTRPVNKWGGKKQAAVAGRKGGRAVTGAPKISAGRAGGRARAAKYSKPGYARRPSRSGAAFAVYGRKPATGEAKRFTSTKQALLSAVAYTEFRRIGTRKWIERSALSSRPGQKSQRGRGMVRKAGRMV